LVFNIKPKLKIDSPASNGSRVKYMKYGRFPSLPVVAAQVLYSSACFGLYITAWYQLRCIRSINIWS